MLTKIEREIVVERSSEWVGPTCWGFVNNYRLNLNESISNPHFG